MGDPIIAALLGGLVASIPSLISIGTFWIRYKDRIERLEAQNVSWITAQFGGIPGPHTPEWLVIRNTGRVAAKNVQFDVLETTPPQEWTTERFYKVLSTLNKVGVLGPQQEVRISADRGPECLQVRISWKDTDSGTKREYETTLTRNWNNK